MTSAAIQTETTPTVARVGLWLPTRTLWQREMVRFFRQRNRVIGALATPLLFWLLLGSGLNKAFSGPADGDVGYLEYFYPGTVVLMLMFTAIFSTISVIEDRREGFLQGVLVAPIPRLSIVLGKVLGGASIATIQGVLMLAIWPLVGDWPGIGPMAAALGIMFVLALSLTAIGLLFAWPCDSTAGFHAIMNLVLMPMWFLSGAVFPVDTAPAWMRYVMLANPLTYGQAAFASALQGSSSSAGLWNLSLPMLVIITVAITIGLTIAATAMVCRPRKDGTA